MIVKIEGFTNEDGWELCGTGFVLNGNILLSAAHNTRNQDNIKCLEFRINCKNNIIDLNKYNYEYHNKSFKENDNIYKDLILYKIKDYDFKSDLELSFEVKDNDEISIEGFIDDTIDIIKFKGTILNTKGLKINVGEMNTPNIKWFDNCLQISSYIKKRSKWRACNVW